ncbi:MAG: hypothetical protein ABI776_08505 [Nocardioidaceae bacterium]
MPWVLVALMLLLVILMGGVLIAVRLLAPRGAHPDKHENGTR